MNILRFTGKIPPAVPDKIARAEIILRKLAELLKQLNAYRATKGLPPLAP